MSALTSSYYYRYTYYLENWKKTDIGYLKTLD